MLIDHIAIWVDDLEKVKDFYLKYFDCSVNNKYENPEKQFASYFLTFSNGVRLELMKRDDILDVNKVERLGLCHIALNVGTREKVNSITQKMELDGYIIDSDPRVTGDGYYESVILDPENNKVELTSIEDYTITIAEEKDLEQLLYLQKCCYLSEAELYNDYSIPPLICTIEDLRKDFVEQTILVLKDKNKIIGSVRGFLKQKTCFVGRLIVDRHYQNMGFGRLLLESIEREYENINRFDLFTGFNSEKNLYLYNKLGYKEFKEEKLGEMRIKFLKKYI